MPSRLTVATDGVTALTASVWNNEFDNIYSGAITRTGGSLSNNDDVQIIFGSSNDAMIKFDTSQTVDALVIGVDTTGRTLIICDKGDETTNFGLSARSNPTIIVHGAAAATNDYMEYASDAISFHSASVAHGMTTNVPTDVYGKFYLLGTPYFAPVFAGFGSSTVGIHPVGVVTTEDTSKGTGSAGACLYAGYVKSGTTIATMSANTNCHTFRNGATTTHILDAEGDSHQDVGTAWTNFDSEDDIQLLTDLSVQVSRPDDPIRAGFQEFIHYNQQKLEDLKLVTFNEDGHHFVNNSQLLRACVGALRQNAARITALEQRLLEA